MASPDIFDPLLVDPASAGIFCDFDGTLSEIVDDPATARPLAGAAEALAELSHVLGVVGVVSGRPVAFLEGVFAPSIMLTGLYGLESAHRGVRAEHAHSGSWRAVVDDVEAMSLARGPKGMHVENKGLSLTLHYRNAPDIEPAVRDWAERQSSRSGLVLRPAKMSVELHPPIDADKGTVLLELATDLSAVCFIGDDVGDLPAFDALDRLTEQGVRAVRVAVRGTEEAAALVERADVGVEGPSGVVALLDDLLARVRARGAS